MRQEPINRLSEKGLRVWRIYGIFQSLIALLLGIGVGVINYFTGQYIWLYIGDGVVIITHWIFINIFISEN